MNLPSVQNLEVSGKKVLVRADLDVPDEEDFRLRALAPTLKFLSDNGAGITLIGHRGRPNGVKVESLGLKPIEERLRKIVREVEFSVLENLRFDPGEEANDSDFAKKLAENGELYVNEAFAASHRVHASIVGLPKLLPHAAGFRFCQEVEKLSVIFENPKRPIVVILGGSKEDKLDLIKPLAEIADKLLIGGRIPDYMGFEGSIRTIGPNEKIVTANLVMDKEDMTINSIERFENEIEKAKTIVIAGPMGKYEDKGHRQGTERIFKKVASSSAHKITGGGDSNVVVSMYNLEDKFDWISVGGGAMLEFLAKQTLPGIEALSY
ncbi:phosphoglycerate kinase [Patescibacteria group bacterium]|nr:phosphoglycerate kinase [Patescibacteria group bacterium]